jgi:hypothetical protein
MPERLPESVKAGDLTSACRSREPGKPESTLRLWGRICAISGCRWERFTGGFVGSYGSVVQQRGNTADFDPVALKALMDRRLEALRVGVTMRLEDVEQADPESFVPEELALMT